MAAPFIRARSIITFSLKKLLEWTNKMYCIIMIVIIMSCRVTIWRAGFLESNPEQKRSPDTVSHSLLLIWYISMILGIIHPLFFGDHGFFEQYISFIRASRDLKMKSTGHPLIQNNMVSLGVLSLTSSPILVTMSVNSLRNQQIQWWMWLRAIWDLHWTLRLDLLF